jgi:hypothetical protein
MKGNEEARTWISWVFGFEKPFRWLLEIQVEHICTDYEGKKCFSEAGIDLSDAVPPQMTGK